MQPDRDSVSDYLSGSGYGCKGGWSDMKINYVCGQLRPKQNHSDISPAYSSLPEVLFI